MSVDPLLGHLGLAAPSGLSDPPLSRTICGTD